MKYSEREKKVMENPAAIEIRELAERHGYTAGWCYITSYGRPCISIRPKDRGFHSFYPEIFFDFKRLEHWTYDADSFDIRIQTVSYGALSPEEYADNLHAMTSALNLVNEIRWKFKDGFSGLEVEPTEFDQEDDEVSDN